MLFEEITRSLEAEKGYGNSDEQITVKISLKETTREERMQEASKPLYLKRYE